MIVVYFKVKITWYGGYIKVKLPNFFILSIPNPCKLFLVALKYNH